MSRYVQFATQSGGVVLVEVDSADIAAPGVEKAGLRRNPGESAVADAQSMFEEAVASTVGRSVDALTRAVSALDVRPAEIELSFGLKATGEVGNIAIAKAAGEANLSVRLLWRPEPA